MTRLNIAVLEADISDMSGRMQTMMAFADFFSKEHYVQVHTALEKPTPSCNMGNFIEAYNLKNITKNDFLFKVPITGKEDYDLILTPYVNIAGNDMESIQAKVPKAKVCCWTISPFQTCKGIAKEYWIPSHTQKLWMLKFRGMPIEGRAHVVYPPHNYSAFRDTAIFPKDRDYDLIWVGRSVENKRLDFFIDIMNQLTDLKGLACIIGNESEIKAKMKIKPANLDFKINVQRAEIATLMGRSRILFQPSIDECSSLTIYEGMNAGCWPIAFGVGAACEQMGPVGDVYYYDSEAIPLIRSAMGMINDSVYRMAKVIDRGWQFDIENTKERLNARLCK